MQLVAILLFAVSTVPETLSGYLTFRPMLRRLRSVLRMVDMAADVSCDAMAVGSRALADLRMVMRRLPVVQARVHGPQNSTSPLLSAIALSHQHASSMITRRASTCLRLSKQPLRIRKPRNHGAFQRRYATTSSAPAATSAGTHSSASQLAMITSELDKLSPRFNVPADSIEILRTPFEFYETLKV